MKAITIRQPWASLIAAGVKTIETRPRSTSYRGRVAIHAGATSPADGLAIGTWSVYRQADATLALDSTGQWHPLPLGAVVASAVLTDCAPIGGPYDFRTGYVDGDDGDYPGQAVVVHHPPMGPMDAYLGLSNADTSTTDITDQLPYGDFTPGRWALLLDDIKPTTERCPVCWGVGNTAGVAYTVGPGWDTTGGVPRCEVCSGSGRCDPIPAKGQQAVPWEWKP